MFTTILITNISFGKRPFERPSFSAVQAVSAIVHAIVAQTIEHRAKRLLIRRRTILVVDIAQMTTTGVGIVDIGVAVSGAVRRHN